MANLNKEPQDNLFEENEMKDPKTGEINSNESPKKGKFELNEATQEQLARLGYIFIERVAPEGYKGIMGIDGNSAGYNHFRPAYEKDGWPGVQDKMKLLIEGFYREQPNLGRDKDPEKLATTILKEGLEQIRQEKEEAQKLHLKKIKDTILKKKTLPEEGYPNVLHDWPDYKKDTQKNKK